MDPFPSVLLFLFGFNSLWVPSCLIEFVITPIQTTDTPTVHLHLDIISNFTVFIPPWPFFSQCRSYLVQSRNCSFVVVVVVAFLFFSFFFGLLLACVAHSILYGPFTHTPVVSRTNPCMPRAPSWQHFCATCGASIRLYNYHTKLQFAFAQTSTPIIIRSNCRKVLTSYQASPRSPVRSSVHLLHHPLHCQPSYHSAQLYFQTTHRFQILYTFPSKFVLFARRSSLSSIVIIITLAGSFFLLLTLFDIFYYFFFSFLLFFFFFYSSTQQLTFTSSSLPWVPFLQATIFVPYYPSNSPIRVRINRRIYVLSKLHPS